MGDSEEERERKRDKVGEFMYALFLHNVILNQPWRYTTQLKYWLIGRKKSLNKGELALKHAVGLGGQPNIVPVTEPIVNGPPRPVEVGWHPVPKI